MSGEVPPDALLCRFIRETDWSEPTGRPKADLFKRPAWSVWDVGLLSQQQVSNIDLRLGDLEGAGQLYYTANDYLEFAEEAVRMKGPGLSLRIVRRTDNTNVDERWQRWAYAHVEVDTTDGPPARDPLTQFRRILTVESVNRAKKMVPPDKFTSN